MSNDLPYLCNPGKPTPFGATPCQGGINFALNAKHASGVTLCLFEPTTQELLYEVILDPQTNKTGNTWHIEIQKLPDSLLYAYRISGESDANPLLCYHPEKFLLDPYAKEVSTSNVWGKNGYSPLGVMAKNIPFDWENDAFPRIPDQDLVIYEMHVRGFTRHSSSNVVPAGTFLGVVEKIPYLLELGVNAVELLPLQEFNEMEYLKSNPLTKKRLCNFWGYSTVNFFAPMNRYSSSNQQGEAILEFKTMVRELHKHGIEVILDIVFNHTAEGNGVGPIISYKGIDNPTYYLLEEDGTYRDFSGCGNTFNCNHPVAQELIIDCLRYWVTEMHVDGFRFDLASILTRGMDGEPLKNSPLIEAISYDPILANTKLIAEPWDAAGLYQVGNFYKQSDRWSEWNAKYRDAVRRFLNGIRGYKGQFATRICGSQDLYGKGRLPTNSINFITAHDGFTLADLVSYNHKHNIENGEDNRDGNNYNDSWNCGTEGPSINPKILALRERQMRNFHLVLMISQGIPMLSMGDEYGHTKHGNNNTWCQDNELNWFLWDQLEASAPFYRFYKGVINFRNQNPLLRKGNFLTDQDIIWHGLEPNKPEWNTENQFIAFTLIDTTKKHEDLYVAFNASDRILPVILPLPPAGKQWHMIVNTSNPPPDDFIEESKSVPLTSDHLDMISHSSILLKAF